MIRRKTNVIKVKGKSFQEGLILLLESTQPIFLIVALLKKRRKIKYLSYI